MMSSEIKETIYVSIGLITVAFVLTLVSFAYMLRDDMANIQNDQRVSKYMAMAKSEYEKYQDHILYGEDVVALIHEYSGKDVLIYIDNLNVMNSSGGTSTIDKVLIDRDGKASVHTTNRTSSTRIFEAFNDIFLNNDDATPDNNSTPYQVDPKATYYSYLVYEDYELNNMSTHKYKDSNGDYTTVTGIVVRLIGPGKHIYITNIAERGRPDAISECGCYIKYKRENNIDSDERAKNECGCKAYDYTQKIESIKKGSL